MFKKNISVLYFTVLLLLAALPITAAKKKNKGSKKVADPAEVFLKEGLPALKNKSICLITNNASVGRYIVWDYIQDNRENKKPATAKQPAKTENKPESEDKKTEDKAIENESKPLLPSQTTEKKQKFPRFLSSRFKKFNIGPVYIFTPEHGITGQEEDHGNKSTTAGKPETIYFMPTEKLAKKFENCQAIVFDLPDSGVRPYTYRTVLTRTLTAAHKMKKKPLYYLVDHPNPASKLGIIGPMVKPAFFSYVGEEAIPFFPSYTQAELAKKYIHDRKLKVNLKIQKLKNYRRLQTHESRGLAFYPPSPSLPHLRANKCYWVSVFFEVTGIEEGRVTKDPFCQIGNTNFEPHRNPPAFGGIKWLPYAFVPAAGKQGGKLVHGYKLDVSSYAVNPTKAAYEFFRFHIKKRNEKNWLYAFFEKRVGLDALVGTDTMRKALLAGKSYVDWYAGENKKVQKFAKQMKKFAIYKD